MCSPAIFETSSSYNKDIWIAATDYYLDLYISDTALKVSRSLHCFTASVCHGSKTISPGCGVLAPLMLFSIY